MSNIKYLDLSGLKTYNERIQSWVTEKISFINPEDISKGVNAYNAWIKFLDGIDLSNPAPSLKDISDSLTALESNKANKATTLSGYGITDAYTITETDEKISEVLSYVAGGVHFIGVKDKLPATSNNGDIVIVGDKEYIWDGANTEWVELGYASEEGERISAIEKLLGDDKTTTIEGRITNAINELNVDGNDTTPATGYDVKAISQISQADGKISVDAYVNIGSITGDDIDNELTWE